MPVFFSADGQGPTQIKAKKSAFIRVGLRLIFTVWFFQFEKWVCRRSRRRTRKISFFRRRRTQTNAGKNKKNPRSSAWVCG